jgi:hypothetical protein
MASPAGPPHPPRVFIAYRRDDSGGYARAVANDLRELWGNDNVFLDVEPDALPRGVDYLDFAQEKVRTSDVVLALIGNGWARSPHLERLAEPEDAVRLEILAAHGNKVALLPVTVGGARMPARGTLPPELAWFERKNAHDLSDTRWTYDMGELVRVIQSLVPAPPAPDPPDIPEPPGPIGPGPRHRILRFWPIAVAVMLLVVVLITNSALDSPFNGAGDTLTQPGQEGTGTPDRASNTSPQAEQEVPSAPAVRLQLVSELSADDARRDSLRIDHEAFLREYRYHFPGDTLTRERIAGLDTVLSLLEADSAMTDLRWAAYLLASIKHETAGRWTPIVEAGRGHGQSYGQPVRVVDPQGREYINVYHGRGFFQLTWKDNYERMGRAIGYPRLVYEPDLALRPDIAYRVAAHGVRQGSFTGRKLAHYINRDSGAYVSARRILNGRDRDTLIAGYAVQFERILRVSEVAPGGEYIVIVSSLNVRSSPDLFRLNVVGTLSEGIRVRVLEERDNWKRVTTVDGILSGWVSTHYLRKADG